MVGCGGGDGGGTAAEKPPAGSAITKAEVERQIKEESAGVDTEAGQPGYVDTVTCVKASAAKFECDVVIRPEDGQGDWRNTSLAVTCDVDRCNWHEQ